MANDRDMAEEVRQYLLQAFSGAGAPPVKGDSERELQLATAVLCLSVVRADRQCSQDEHHIVISAIERLLGLGADDTARLLRAAEEAMAADRPWAEFVSRIDRGFSHERKCRVLESLWLVAFADAELEGHEEYLVRK